MPLPIMLAHKLVRGLSEVRRTDGVDYLRPDGKSQVTVEYDGDKPVRIDAIVLSTQHSPTVTQDTIRARPDRAHHQRRSFPADLMDEKTKIYVNPTGRFVTGGPHGDAGVTGRKIIVDTYGGAAPHGGGAFSGKDPTKVDRSACYMARYIAKNIVAAGLADRALVQLAYAIGVADRCRCSSTRAAPARVADEKMTELVRAHFKLTPRGIIETLDLRRPIYRKTAAFGHFGRTEPEFTWETDRQGRRAEAGRSAGSSGRAARASDPDAAAPRGRCRLVAAVVALTTRVTLPPRARDRWRPCRRRSPSARTTSTPHARTARARSTRSRAPPRARARVRHPHRSRRRDARARSARVSPRRARASTPWRSARSPDTSSRSASRPAPYPLAGEARDVDRRHSSAGRPRRSSRIPDSPKPELRWRGVERGVRRRRVAERGLGVARRDAAARCSATALRSLVRGPRRSRPRCSRVPIRTLQRWDTAGAAARVCDRGRRRARPHRLGQRGRAAARRTVLARPPYEDMFRTLVQGVDSTRRSRTTRAQAARLIVHSSAAARSRWSARSPTPARSRLPREQGGTPCRWAAGCRLGPVRMHAAVRPARRVHARATSRGPVVATRAGKCRVDGADPPGAYRVEVAGRERRRRGSCRIRSTSADEPSPARRPLDGRRLTAGRRSERIHGWRDRARRWRRRASVTTTPRGRVRVPARRGYSGRSVRGARATSSGLDGARPRAFTGRADRPVRVSVQLRLLGGGRQRWRRSVYLDDTPRPVTVASADFDAGRPIRRSGRTSRGSCPCSS